MPPKSSNKSRPPPPKPERPSERPQKKPKIQNDDPSKSQKPTLKSPPPPKKAKNAASVKGKERAATSRPKVLKEKAQKAKKEEDPLKLPSTFKIMAGSYEKLLYGLEGSVSADLEFTLKPLFIFPAHVSCVKAVAASPEGGKWLATGSADEIVKVWDLRRRKEVGGLMHHEGSITHLVFPTRSHLLSASEDGTLALFRTRDWAVLRSLKGHKGRVNAVAVHPSGKVALSVGKDRTLRMWDLMRGRGGASMRLGFEGELVRWSTTGTLFMVQHQKQIDLYTTDLALLHTLTHASRIHDVAFVSQGSAELMLVAGEDGKTAAYDVSALRDGGVEPPILRAHFVGHGNRVKALSTLRIALPAPARPATTILASVSSDGTIHVYDLFGVPPAGADAVASIEPVAAYDSKGSRLTCVVLADGEAAGVGMDAGVKRKWEVQEEEEEEWPSEQEEDEGEDDEGEEEEED